MACTHDFNEDNECTVCGLIRKGYEFHPAPPDYSTYSSRAHFADTLDGLTGALRHAIDAPTLAALTAAVRTPITQATVGAALSELRLKKLTPHIPWLTRRLGGPAPPHITPAQRAAIIATFDAFFASLAPTATCPPASFLIGAIAGHLGIAGLTPPLSSRGVPASWAALWTAAELPAASASPGSGAGSSAS